MFCTCCFILLSLLFSLPSHSKEISFEPITKKVSVTLSFDNVRARGGSFGFYQSREGNFLLNPVDPYLIEIVSVRSLLNHGEVSKGALPVMGRALRVRFARGAEGMGYEVRDRVLSYVNSLDRQGEVQGVVSFVKRDFVDGSESKSVVLTTNRAQAVVKAIEDLGLSQKEIYLNDIQEMANAIEDPDEFSYSSVQ